MPVHESTYSKTVRISADASRVWEALTDHLLMAEWMYDTEISIVTDWKVGSPIEITTPAEEYKPGSVNTGFVLEYERERKLQYSHLSSLSKLPDQTEYYTVITFSLKPGTGYTELTLSLSNFPTESIFKHMVFYWEVTLEILRKFIESANKNKGLTLTRQLTQYTLYSGRRQI